MSESKKSAVIFENGAVYVLRAGTPVYFKTADICTMTGKSNQWIGQFVCQGTINKKSTPHGSMFEAAGTIRAYCAKLEARADDAFDKEKSAADLSLKKAKAVIATMEAKELQGKMHRSEDVAAMTEDLIYTIRAAFLALPGRLAVDTAAATTPAETAEIIRTEVYRAMEGIANYQYDCKKYEERVRERMSWDTIKDDLADEDD